jgi:hypothetical protein
MVEASQQLRLRGAVDEGSGNFSLTIERPSGRLIEESGCKILSNCNGGDGNRNPWDK